MRLHRPGQGFCEWHPFTVLDGSALGPAAAPRPPGAAREAAVLFKVAGRWTQGLLADAGSGAAGKGGVPVLVQGPFGEDLGHWASRAARVVLVAGGVGVTPCLAVLQHLVGHATGGGERLAEDGALEDCDEERRGLVYRGGQGGHAVDVLWVLRAGQVELVRHVEPLLREASRRPGLGARVQVHLTGGAGPSGDWVPGGRGESSDGQGKACVDGTGGETPVVQRVRARLAVALAALLGAALGFAWARSAWGCRVASTTAAAAGLAPLCAQQHAGAAPSGCWPPELHVTSCTCVVGAWSQRACRVCEPYAQDDDGPRAVSQPGSGRGRLEQAQHV